MDRSRPNTARAAWLYLGLGIAMVTVVTIRDWSTWPDLRTVLAALVGTCAVGVAITGAVMLAKGRKRRSGPT